MMLNAENIEDAISGGVSTFIEIFHEKLSKECVDNINKYYVIPFMSKLPSEELPINERNLTDARTRIGQLLEVWFCLTLQHIFETQGISKFRMSCVVANQYPDLVIRSTSSEIVLRIEMKALELVSEEKSANFDALVRDIHPQQDLLCVLLWEWIDLDLSGTLVNIPEVKGAFIFEAYPLARARDLGWLAQRKNGQLKGIDITGPVVGTANTLKEEEHNMGKLMRIPVDIEDVRILPKDLAEHPTIKAYREFKQITVSAGLAYNATRLLKSLGIHEDTESTFVHSSESIQTIARGIVKPGNQEVVVATAGRFTKKTLNSYVGKIWGSSFISGLWGSNSNAALLLIFNEKFSWYIYSYDGILRELRRGKKYYPAFTALKSLLNV